MAQNPSSFFAVVPLGYANPAAKASRGQAGHSSCGRGIGRGIMRYMHKEDQPAVLRAALRRWGSRQRGLAGERDPLVLAALDAGITREEIHILTGLGRTTIDRIVQVKHETGDPA